MKVLVILALAIIAVCISVPADAGPTQIHGHGRPHDQPGVRYDLSDFELAQAIARRPGAALILLPSTPGGTVNLSNGLQHKYGLLPTSVLDNVPQVRDLLIRNPGSRLVLVFPRKTGGVLGTEKGSVEITLNAYRGGSYSYYGAPLPNYPRTVITDAGTAGSGSASSDPVDTSLSLVGDFGDL